MTATTDIQPEAQQAHFALTFATRDNDRCNHWIEGEYDADAPKPEAFFADMAAIGFIEDASFAALPPYTSSQAGCRIQEFTLSKKGSALFAGWTDEEKRTNMAAARRVMRKHGFTRVPVWRKTLADML